MRRATDADFCFRVYTRIAVRVLGVIVDTPYGTQTRSRVCVPVSAECILITVLSRRASWRLRGLECGRGPVVVNLSLTPAGTTGRPLPRRRPSAPGRGGARGPRSARDKGRVISFSMIYHAVPNDRGARVKSHRLYTQYRKVSYNGEPSERLVGRCRVSPHPGSRRGRRPHSGRLTVAVDSCQSTHPASPPRLLLAPE